MKRKKQKTPNWDATTIDDVHIHAALELGFDSEEVEEILESANVNFLRDGALKCWITLCKALRSRGFSEIKER